MGAPDTNRCPWEKRSGAIRDFPEFGVEECQNCKLVSHEKDLRKFVDYASGSMHDWASGYGGMLATPPEDTSRRVSKILALSETFNIKTVLDFGSGSGEMIEALSLYFNTEGLEPEDHARETCNAQGMTVYASTREILEKSGHFDLITLFHVVEHFYKPDSELSNIWDLLSPGGLLVIETPNSQDALLTKFKSSSFADFTYWTHHPMLHSSESLAALVLRANFNLVENTGSQRYGLENHLFWLSNDLPGGHVKWNGLISPPTNLCYENDLISAGMTDTIWLVAQKPLSSREDISAFNQQN